MATNFVSMKLLVVSRSFSIDSAKWNQMRETHLNVTKIKSYLKKERVKDIEGTAKTYSDVSDFNP